jgi:RNA processing factor Prp31
LKAGLERRIKEIQEKYEEPPLLKTPSPTIVRKPPRRMKRGYNR